MADRGRSHDAGSDRGHAAVIALVTPALAAAGFVLEDLRLTPAGKYRVLRVLVDRADGADPPDAPLPGLSLDEVATASRAVSAALDSVSGSADPLGSAPYTLEVSSPGVDRPLTLPRHFRRNVGRLVVLRTAAGDDVTGRIAGVGAGELLLRTDHGEQAFTWDQVESGQVQVEFTRPDDPADSDEDSDEDEEG